jgi:hypothetical protein
MRSLVVYHSRTGTTRKVAELAAKRLGADIVEVRTPHYGLGALNYLRAGYDSYYGKMPEIEPSRAVSGSYDFVLLLAPVWAGHASTPLRAYLMRNKGIKRAAAVLTCGGHTPPKAFDELSALANVRLDQTFVLREADVRKSVSLPTELDAFLSSLLLKQAA